MSKKLLSIWAALFAVITQSFARDFAIRDGDRVVFLGDSITEQRLYTTYIEGYALSRHPTWKLSFRNVGWGGDTSWLRQRSHPDEPKLFAADEAAQQKMVEDSVGNGLARDVLPLRPTFVTIKFGMNDHSYQALRPDILRAYVRSQTQLHKVLSENGARVAFLTPQPIEDKRADPDKDVKNQSLKAFSASLKEVATKTGAGFADQFNPYMDILLEQHSKNPQGVIGGGDAVHPGPPGQTLMAWLVLKALGATPLVSKAEIDVAKQGAKFENCRVSNLEVAGGTVRFDRLDDALPMPIDARAEPTLSMAPVLDELSWFGLKVTGLKEGTYEVTIDGESAGKVTAEALGKGWNLTNSGGPITKQTRDLLQSIFRKNDLYFARWRNVQLFAFPGWAKGPEVEVLRNRELSRLDGQIMEEESKIDSLRKPVLHRFEIKPSSP